MHRTVLTATAAALLGSAPLYAEEAWQQTFTPPPPMPEADQSGLADVNGIQMHYAVYGEGQGEPILLIHGGFGHGDIWGAFVPELSKEHEIIVADTRGHGRSTRTEEPLSYHLLASDYVALLDVLEVDRVSVVGWSDGGIIGYDLAINHPDRVARLLTHGSNANPEGWNAGEIPQTAALTQSGESDVAAYKAMSLTPDAWEDFQAAVFEMWNTEPNFTTEQLASISAPTWIALGEHDEFIKRDHALYIAETIPGATFVMMPDVSHLATYQDPEMFLELIQDFMD